MRLLVLALLCGAVLAGGVWAQQAPIKAAYMWNAWPNGQGAFKDEFDATFKALGWQCTKFENTQAQELSSRLGEFDIVVGGGVSNLENAQDFKPFAAQWQAFLNRGGVVIATDASYAGINELWIGGIDPALLTRSATCAAHTRPGDETSKASFAASDPLLTIPYSLAKGLDEKSFWAHMTDVGDGWTKPVLCFDKQPLLVYRPYGKGLVVVTSYFRFQGGSEEVASRLLQNALTLARTQQQGLRLTALDMPQTLSLGRNQISLTVANVGAEPAPLSLHLQGKAGTQAEVSAERTKTIAPGETAALTLPFTLPARGTYDSTLTLKRNGQTALEIHPAVVVPELLVARLRSRHAFVTRPQLVLSLTLAPELQGRLPATRVEVRPVGPREGEQITLTMQELSETKTVSLGDLPPGAYDLRATLFDGEKKLADVKTPFALHPRPKVYFNDRNVCLVDDKPFFLLAMYHVAWGATKEQMLQCVEDLAAMGFNGIHTSCTNLDTYQEVLDRAQARGLKVLPEGIGPGSPAMQRFKSHPAILAWNSGDEPDGAGTPPEKVGDTIDAVRDTDFDHPLYTTLCVPNSMAKYAPYLDVFSTDPYPLAGGNKDAIQVAKQTAQARDLVQQSRPLWIVPQCFGYADGPWQIPTPAQERSMSYQALIEGANGLNWYVYDDVKFKLMEHPELVAMMKQLTAEIKTLTPFLLDPAYDALRFQAGPKDCVRACAIKDGKTLLIMAAHTNEKDLGAQELTVPGLPAGAKAEVLFENRSLNTTGGKITDTFAPYAVHVYRVRL